jgi:uncharacterized short protein YbdD (DUF466 family)
MTTRERVERAAEVIRRIIGVPDYDRYVEHCAAHHPDEKPMTRDEFFRYRVTDKYSRPGGRCC